MRSIRPGLIVSSALIAFSFGSSGGSLRPDAEAVEFAPLRVIDRGDGERVWVRFDRPMVEPEGIGSPAPLEVDLPGRATWTTVATAAFIPGEPLPPSRAVSVALRDVVALDGSRLAVPISWTFRTPGLEIDGGIPSIVARRPGVELQFNRPCD